MFAVRQRKNKNKRRRVEEPSHSNDEEDKDMDKSVVISTESFTERKKLNQFSTGNSLKSSKVKAQFQKDKTFASERLTAPKEYAGHATYETQIDTATDRDARAIMEKNIELNSAAASSSTEDVAVYKGQAGYTNYIKKDQSQIGKNKVTGTQGPIRATKWARSICRFDYQPDICKDYKETGYCGYGDNCKFLHDRGDYKSGWQIEKEYNEKERKKKQLLEKRVGASSGNNRDIEVDEEDGEDDAYVIHSDDDDDEQFACTICRKPFRNAIETLCNHYFCEQCALKRYQKTPKCYNCKRQTNGVFNAATKLRQRERDQTDAATSH